MDVLDRLTNKAALEKAYGAKSGQLIMINAEELAGKLKSRVIGQDAAIDSDWPRSCAGASRRSGPTSRWRCSALPAHPASERPISPR